MPSYFSISALLGIPFDSTEPEHALALAVSYLAASPPPGVRPAGSAAEPTMDPYTKRPRSAPFSVNELDQNADPERIRSRRVNRRRDGRVF